MSCQAARDTGNEEHDSVGVEEHGTTGGAGHVHEGGFGIRVGGIVRQNTLSHVDLETTEKSGEDADEDGSEENVAARIFYFFSEDGDPVEADENESSETCAGSYQTIVKSFGIVEWLE